MHNSTLDEQLPYFRRFKDIVPGHQFIQTHSAEPSSAIPTSTDSESKGLCNGVISDSPTGISLIIGYIGITSIDEATDSILSIPGKRQVDPGKKREVRHFVINIHFVPFDRNYYITLDEISQINPSWGLAWHGRILMVWLNNSQDSTGTMCDARADIARAPHGNLQCFS